MSTKPKKTGPAASSITSAYKQAQEAKNKSMAEVLDALAGSISPPAFRAALAEHKKRGRPATGRVPDKDRKAKQRALLTQAGGRQLSIELLPEHAAALDAIKARKGYTSDREAVCDWLARAAKRAKA